MNNRGLGQVELHTNPATSEEIFITARIAVLLLLLLFDLNVSIDRYRDLVTHTFKCIQ